MHRRFSRQIRDGVYLLFFVIGIFASSSLYCQIGIGTTEPDPSAELDIYANDKGLLIPGVSLGADLSNPFPVTDPAEGLLVFNTGLNQEQGLYYWTGSEWQIMQTPTDDTLSGPASSTDNAMVRFNGNSGKLLQNSLVTLDDSDRLANVNVFNTTGLTLTANPVAGRVLTSNALGTGTWQPPSSLNVSEEGQLIVSGATSLNFTGGSTVLDGGNNSAKIAFYENSVTKDLIQLASGDSLNLNIIGSSVPIPWNIELQKNNATYIHSNNSNPSRIYTRVTGIYEINYIVNTISQTIQRKTLRIRVMKNGSEIINYSNCYSFSYNMADFESAHNSSSFLIQMDAGDYVEVIANGQTNDGPLLLKPNQNVMFVRLIRENQ